MAVILLRLAAPLQAWGDESKYEAVRGTMREPTKSGVIGLLAAALGLRRDSPEIGVLSDKLRLGVRVDQPGTVIGDFHTALPPKYKKDGSISFTPDMKVLMEDSGYVTNRYYLTDAAFLVGLESEDAELINRLYTALEAPAFPLYLGRRSCPVTQPLVLGIFYESLEEILTTYPWIASVWYKNTQKNLHARIMLETKKGEPARYFRMDKPVSFNPIHRMYSLRGLERDTYVQLGTQEHDPMAAIFEEVE